MGSWARSCTQAAELAVVPLLQRQYRWGSLHKLSVLAVVPLSHGGSTAAAVALAVVPVEVPVTRCR